MKKFFIIALLLIITAPAFAEPLRDGIAGEETQTEMPENYQQFKQQFLNTSRHSGNHIPAQNFRGQSDYTMLYVAGGLLAVTGGLAYLNANQNNSGFFSSDNTGMLIGGGFSATIFLTKYFVDRYRTQ